MDAANDAYYRRTSPGRSDYWKKMAAPRLRARRLLEELAREEVGSVADLGCGGGELLSRMAAWKPSLRLCGVDASAAQLAENRRRHPDRDWLEADLDLPPAFLPALTGAFDVVIASEVIEHVELPLELLANARALAGSFYRPRAAPSARRSEPSATFGTTRPPRRETSSSARAGNPCASGTRDSPSMTSRSAWPISAPPARSSASGARSTVLSKTPSAWRSAWSSA